MEFKLRDDITRKDIMTFVLLVLFLAFWVWFVFSSGYIV